MKIQTMLDFERSRDTAGHAEHINDEVAALEEALQKCHKNEKKYRKVSVWSILWKIEFCFLEFRSSKICNMK